MKPSDYFKDFVEPSIKDVELNPQDIRLAYCACLFTYHFADVVSVYTRRTKGEIRKEIAKESLDAFQVIEGVANMVKHIELHDPELQIKPKPEDTNIGASAPFDRGGYFDCGVGWSDSERVVTIRDNKSGLTHDLRHCLRSSADAIKVYLQRPELK